MLNIEEFAKSGQLFDGHYKLLRPLSTDGGTADVWLAEDTNTIDQPLELDDEPQEENKKEDTGMLVAIKIYRPKNALDIEGEQRFRDEYKIVYECRHANLLQPTGFSIFEEIPYLVLPYCKNGSAEKLIGKELTKDELWKFILDVSSGLDRLHTNNPIIIHQDIKPANILIDNNQHYTITDFGISSRMGGTHGYYYDDGNSGTLAYMGPERFHEHAVPIWQSDIWAFGATLCEILTGQVPFGEEGGREQAENNLDPPVIKGIPADVQRLINDCLSANTDKRPTAATIKEAAAAQQYPVKSRMKLVFSLIAFLFVAMIGVGTYLLYNQKEVVPPPPPPSPQEVYEKAMAYMNYEERDSLEKGLGMLDSIGNLGYIPALYEIGLTYGWTTDDQYMKRKDLLGISYQNDRKHLGLPNNININNRSVNAFQRIVESDDSAHYEMKAKAAHKLAVYYFVDNSFYNPNKDLAVRLLKKAINFAQEAKVLELVEKLNVQLERVTGQQQVVEVQQTTESEPIDSLEEEEIIED